MSTIKATTLSNLAGSQTVPVDTVAQGSSKAWVNFNGTGTVAIRRAFNVSSITDNGTGDYTVNFTSAMSDANYAAVGSGGDGSIAGGVRCAGADVYTTSSFRFPVRDANNTLTDPVYMNVSIFS